MDTEQLSPRPDDLPIPMLIKRSEPGFIHLFRLSADNDSHALPLFGYSSDFVRSLLISCST